MQVNLKFVSSIYKFIKRVDDGHLQKKRNDIIKNLEDDPNHIQKLHLDPKFNHKKLYQFHLFSSHNSYLLNYQNFDFCDISIVDFLLRLGVRCLEFDVYYLDGKLLIGHGTKNMDNFLFKNIDLITTNMIKLHDVFKLIKEIAFQNLSDMPLIINLELLTRGDMEAHQKIVDKINNYFHGHILGPKFHYAAKNLGTCKLKHLRKKIIFITGRKLNDNDPLAKYINAYTYMLKEFDEEIDPKQILNLSSREIKFANVQQLIKKHVANKGLVRVYPAGGIMTHFSHNFDFHMAAELGVQFMAMNIQQFGSGVNEYFNFFNGIPIKEITHVSQMSHTAV